MERSQLMSIKRAAVFTPCSAPFRSDLESLSCFVLDDDGVAVKVQLPEEPRVTDQERLIDALSDTDLVVVVVWVC